jgi:hypothetical protein
MPPFKPTHGLIQCDLLSPYLFILCMEKLSISINNVVLQGNWEPIHITNSGTKLSHLLFADDVLLFSKAWNSQLRFISNLFDRFSHASGLKINLSKSRLSIPQAFHKLRLTSWHLFLELEALFLLISIWASLFWKEVRKGMVSILLLRKCKQDWHSGKIDCWINLVD